MRKPDIALGCAPVDPDPILLERITMLAAASVAPGSTPWWQRVATRSGAVAVASVMALSGAAYAARGELTPIVKSMTGGTTHPVVRQHVVRDLFTPGPAVSSTPPVVIRTLTVSAMPTQHSRRARGFHPKRGEGVGWTNRHDHGHGRGHAFGRESRGNGGNDDSNWSGSSDNAQGPGHGRGKALGHAKTGWHSASHGNHYGWSQSQGQTEPPN